MMCSYMSPIYHWSLDNVLYSSSWNDPSRVTLVLMTCAALLQVHYLRPNDELPADEILCRTFYDCNGYHKAVIKASKPKKTKAKKAKAKSPEAQSPVNVMDFCHDLTGDWGQQQEMDMVSLCQGLATDPQHVCADLLSPHPCAVGA